MPDQTKNIKIAVISVFILFGAYMLYFGTLGQSPLFENTMTRAIFRSVFDLFGLVFLAFGCLLAYSKKFYGRFHAFVFRRETVYVLIIAMLIFGSLEIILRVAESSNPIVLRPDRTYHHLIGPNLHSRDVSNEWNTLITTNSIGLRNSEIMEKKLPRIFVMGDSFTMGLGVQDNETFSRLLGDKLAGRYEVINGGVGSHSTILYYMWLRDNIWKINPDIVVVNLDISDFYDDLKYERIANYNESGEIVSVDGYGDVGLSSVIVDSRVIRKIRYFIGLAIQPKTIIEENQIGDMNYDKFAITRLDKPFNETHSGAWNLSSKYMLKLKQLSEQHNFKLVFVVYPYGHQVAGQWEAGRTSWLLEPGKVYPDIYATVIQDFLEANNVTTLDVFPDFKNSSRKTFYDLDGHFTVVGHQLMADSILNGLEEKKII